MSEPLSFLLPPPPKSWDKDKDFKIHSKSLAAFNEVTIEPVGHEFWNVTRRIRMKRTLEEDIELEAALHAAEEEDVNLEEDEPETKKLLASDPNNWKNQDHYAILGISKLRWKANDEDIKRAYRRKVLKHHPDKKAAASGSTNDDSFFKCIQKAWEVLSDNVKRRQWDSVDPKYDESVPTRALKPGEDFFDVYGPAFDKEARFSKKELPPFGNNESSREEVEAFYDAWFNMDSWRTFEMLDEEEESGGDSREEKRYYERKNRAARQKLKKEDNARVLRFVESALKNDPRIIRIKEEEKAAKEAKRKEKEYAAQAGQREAAKKAEEERLAKEKEEKEEKERREQEKKEKEAHKKVVRKMKKEIKTIFSNHNNLLPSNASVSTIEDQVNKLENLLENSELWHMEEFRFRLEQESGNGVSALQKCFDDEIGSMKERQENAAKDAQAQKASTQASLNGLTGSRKTKAPWTPKEQATLIKAFKTFPGGTVQRWEKIADYVNLHGVDEGEESGSRARGPDDCIKKSKELQAVSTAERAALQQAVVTKKKEIDVKDAPTAREAVNTDLAVKPTTNGSAPATPANGSASPLSKKTSKATLPTTTGGFVVPEDASWSAAQQAQLEAALRKYPASAFTAAPSERWEKIATEVDGKNKKEVKQRVKDLADAIKKKNKK
ncbi:hypothetical protein HDU97_004587 [Phlyctochytrium planicorne]|nr:hypothetical protein HDU97_004587 [Phlyctochytrium planicorne]